MSLYACVVTQWEGQRCTIALSYCTARGCCFTCTHERLKANILCCNMVLYAWLWTDVISSLTKMWGGRSRKRLTLLWCCRGYSQLKWAVWLFPANRLNWAKIILICAWPWWSPLASPLSQTSPLGGQLSFNRVNRKFGQHLGGSAILRAGALCQRDMCTCTDIIQSQE